MRLRGRIGIALLLSVLGIGPVSVAQAQQGCEIEEAQRLFGQQPRPAALLEGLLSSCVAAGSTDYRVYMFLGVMARDAGKGEQAVAFLRKAHEMAPTGPNPALELSLSAARSPGPPRGGHSL